MVQIHLWEQEENPLAVACSLYCEKIRCDIRGRALLHSGLERGDVTVYLFILLLAKLCVLLAPLMLTTHPADTLSESFLF